MFSAISSYIFGASEEPSSTDVPATAECSPTDAASKQDVHPVESPQLETRQTEDDEWLLVEKSSPETSRVRPRYPLWSTPRPMRHEPLHECSLAHLFKSYTPNTSTTDSRQDSGCYFDDILDSSLCISQGLGYHGDEYHHGDSGSGHHSDTADSDLSSVPEPMVYPSMEESWLVTPPACFTAEIARRMETSSMENLLIEHPSMSVYSHRGRPSSTGDESDQSSSDAEETETSESKHREAGLARHHEPPHRPNALAARVGLTQVKAVKAMQKSQQRQLYKNLSANRILRSNVVREVKSQGNNTRRYRNMQQPTRRAQTQNKQY